MCGITGLFAFDGSPPVDESLGRQMVETLTHRGPDDGGLLVAPNTMLGHRRLSIIDLSANGHQPMSDENDRCWIVFNGEIYNFREFRSELKKAGQRFRSDTDTEVILRGYLAWGRDVVHRLNGMFAFAIWDRRLDELWLVRDPIGIKPLFYTQQGGDLRFASEIKSLLLDPRRPARPDWRGLDLFLTYGYTPAPATGFAGIRQLRPGQSLVARRSGSVEPQTWYRLPYPGGPAHQHSADAVTHFQSSLDAAVKRQMVADVPLGAFLSGGLDSSAIVRAMKRSQVDAIETFTIGFGDKSFDESPFAAQVAEIYGSKHRSQDVAADTAKILGSVVSHAEEPLADNSAIPLFLLSESARRQVKVALSGDGADELLAGYSTYRASQVAPYYRCLPHWLRQRVFRPLVQRLPTSRTKYGPAMLLQRFVSGADLPFPKDHCSWRRLVSDDLRPRLLTKHALSQAEPDPLDLYAAELDDAPDWLTPLERQLHLDLRFHLPNDMLTKVDRMSMAHSLEVRVPFLDLEVVQTCLTIPPVWKRHAGRGKRVLADMLSADLPASLVNRRKSGFLIPLELWLRREWKPLLDSVLTSEFAEDTGAFHWPVLQQMLQDHADAKADHSYALFALLVLGIWWRMWITRETPPTPNRVESADLRVVHVPGPTAGQGAASKP